MSKKISSKIKWLALSILTILLAVYTLSSFFLAKTPHAHADQLQKNTVSITSPMKNEEPLATSVSIVRPGEKIMVTGHGFAFGDTLSLHLDNVRGPSLASLACNHQGICSGMVTMPSNAELEGIHILYGTNATGSRSIQTHLHFVPGLTVSPHSGGIGSLVTINGNSFAAYETLNIYWGMKNAVFEGSVTTDGQGNFSRPITFIAPTDVTPGTYPIVVRRTHRIPATVVVPFSVNSPTMTCIPESGAGQRIQAEINNFQPQEAMTLTWGGGPQLLQFDTDTAGHAQPVFNAPLEPKGTYTATATGLSSGLSTTCKVNVGPGVILYPASANPGSTISVILGGYTPGKTVQIYFQNTKNGVMTQTVPTSGIVGVNLTVPTTFKANTGYYVYGNTTDGKQKSKAPFTFTIPTIGCSDYFYYCNLSYGQLTQFYGEGFSSGESVQLYWGNTLLTTTAANNVGSIFPLVTPPSTPQDAVENVVAIGVTSGRKATTIGYEYASGYLTSAYNYFYIPGGASTQITFGAFNPDDTVSATLQGTTLVNGTTDASGFFSTSFIMPSFPIGSYALQVSNGSGSIAFTINFDIAPTLTVTPTSLPSGGTLTVNGSSYSSSSSCTHSAHIYVENAHFYEDFGEVSTSDGNFTTTITPSGLTSGTTYQVWAFDGCIGIPGIANFSAQ